MLLDPNSVSGLSDAGAHVMMISDCSSSTFHLTHWVRDRTKGERVPLELAVHKLTGAPAEMYGFDDRGVVGVGPPGRPQRHRLRQPHDPGALHPRRPAHRRQPHPAAVHRLPGHDGRRRASCAAHDEDTGARPGRPPPQRPEATADGGPRRRRRRGRHRRPRLGARARPRRPPGHARRARRHPDARRRRGRVRVGPHRRAAGAPPARVPRAGPHDPARPVPRRARRRSADLGIEPPPIRNDRASRSTRRRSRCSRPTTTCACSRAAAPPSSGSCAAPCSPSRASTPSSARASPASSSRPAADGPPIVTGVRLEDGTVLAADLVVATTGRRGDVPAWLDAHGIDGPRDRRATPASSTSPASTARTTTRRFGFRGGFGAGLVAGVIGADAGTYSITAVVDRNDKELRAHLSDSGPVRRHHAPAPRAGRRRRRRRRRRSTRCTA